MQQSELDFINTLRQSSRYIQEHRGKTCVIYLPGTLLAQPDSLKQLGNDIGLLHHLGLKTVLVMGATRQIDSALSRAGIEWQTHRNVRVTSAAMLEPFQQAIGQVRSQLEAVFSQASALLSNPVSIVSGNWVIARPKGVIDGIDFQHTGKLRKIDHHGISACLDSGQIVLLTPLAYSLTGEVFNLNTLEQACEVANALKADKLMIYTKPEMLAHIPKQLSIPELRHFIEQLEESDQKRLLRQIDNSNQFIKRVHLLDERDPSALLMELFSRDGCGTLIFSDRYHQLRAAHIEDVGGILELISPLEEQGILVKRSRERLELEIGNFLLLERDQTIIGCAAIYPHAARTAELACLAVHTDYQGQELGEQLLKAIEAKARDQGIETLFLLTTHTHHWFIEHGFALGTVEELPSERQSLYNLKRQSKVLIKPLSSDN